MNAPGTNSAVYFVHISDTHFGPTRGFEHYGSNAYNVARRMVDAINSLPVEIDGKTIVKEHVIVKGQ